MKIHEKYIRRCIELGENGLGSTAPNPMVGCVIVHQDSIIGEGFTSPFGGPHAEVNAIESVEDKSLLEKATLYVTLEPCFHFGKTPPCADLIIAYQIPEVVIGLLDPHEKVGGKGIEKLKKSGCEVTIGVLEEECRAHHKRFLSFHERQRPYIILKWAETQDGFIAPEKSARSNTPEPYWITNSYSRQRVHQWRSEEQAILVGTQTVLEDNPSLTLRDWVGKHPIRIVLDRDLRIPKDFKVLDQESKSIVITQNSDANKMIKGVHYEIADFNRELATQICEILYRNSINSVIVEGGTQTLQTFIDAKLWDEARIFRGEITFGNGLVAPKISGKVKTSTKIQSDSLTLLTP
ncbi:bifunctional diaminohydroxyphosphoribosylaminopyrimidine deaminase/5-amino-6-(5-phosphoribosylamino)uracil reductase RibD [Flagellimonas allohymeniacidonis]|uniref:Riboflavin biosynthesis protein RibD n=1 Tax=Flagellimonas allohymeniacidonis TaxID=2517819 RepID=A0A4V2HSU5_9FLAO|nr:bifunctional diaminohydroxyphosphoribosylaminopyrimidine deaminase/5-amino-6-(5-phosphoribosylamino)uracil reductase RibD [Allomuricauda hymeniacidonis]TAI49080.1 bifunctional diaminohydroxyphosphoribosylaminopyrimidine deaminase/5-amino-6-(5-phosphoribosylamino)uracil reductase RibD [Allomuricauda hymeniacidonis]